MIQANELRIGNWVEVENYKFIQLANIHSKGTTLGDEPYLISMLMPILLTKEILLKCGFIQLYRRGSCVRLELIDQPEYEFKSNSFHSQFRPFFEGHCMAGIKYLHQLQNLYFALTGRELWVSL